MSTLDTTPVYNINVKSGDEWWAFQATITNVTDPEVGPQPVNLLGASIVMQVRKAPCNNNLIYEFSTENEKIGITDAENGVFRVNSQIIDIPAGRYVYDIEVRNSGLGYVRTIVKGDFNVIEDVTRNS